MYLCWVVLHGHIHSESLFFFWMTDELSSILDLRGNKSKNAIIWYLTGLIFEAFAYSWIVLAFKLMIKCVFAQMSLALMVCWEDWNRPKVCKSWLFICVLWVFNRAAVFISSFHVWLSGVTSGNMLFCYSFSVCMENRVHMICRFELNPCGFSWS